jgi:hypothetical protein
MKQILLFILMLFGRDCICQTWKQFEATDTLTKADIIEWSMCCAMGVNKYFSQGMAFTYDSTCDSIPELYFGLTNIEIKNLRISPIMKSITIIHCPQPPPQTIQPEQKITVYGTTAKRRLSSRPLPKQRDCQLLQIKSSGRKRRNP